MRGLVVALICVVLVAALPLAGHCAPQPVTIVADGQTLSLNPPALFDNGIVLCPAAAYMEALGANVSYDPQQSFVMGVKFGRPIVFFGTERIASWGEERIQFDSPPAYINGVMYVQMRFTAEKLGFSVKWAKAKLTATLTAVPFSATRAKVFLDGAEMKFAAPSFFDARCLVCPAEEFLRKLGAYVEWHPASRALAAEEGGVLITTSAEQLNVTVNGQNHRVKRGLGIINSLPYVPAEFYATTLRYGYRWDEASKTAYLTTNPVTSLSETLISQDGWRDPKLHGIPGAGLMVIARKAAPDRDIIFAMGSSAGDDWQATSLPEPYGINGGEFDGFALSPNELFCHGGIIVNAANLTQMPVWRCQAGGQWQQTAVLGSDPRVTRRFATSVTAAPTGLVYAAGYENTGTEMIGQHWRSADRGLTWAPLCDGNGHLRGGTASMAGPGTVTGGFTLPGGGRVQVGVPAPQGPLRVYDVWGAAPDGTVWGCAWENLLRIEPGGAAGFVPFPSDHLREIVDIEAPTNTDVYVLALRGAIYADRQYFISASSDRGATWQTYPLGQPHTAPVLIDFASANGSVMARDFTRENGVEAWLMTITRDDWRATFDNVSLPTHNVLGVLMPRTDRACILAHKVNPKLLYILRWDILP